MSDREADHIAKVSLGGIGMDYPGVRALDDVSIDLRRGEVHALIGENGAGKSTLIKIIAGVVQPDSGRMRLARREVSFATPSAANAAGVVCIFQELSLMPDLSVADNISIASPPRRLCSSGYNHSPTFHVGCGGGGAARGGARRGGWGSQHLQ